MKVITVVGTRPNFIKITQFPRVFKAAGIDHKIVHTGQHYDHKMSTVFFDQFGFQPDVFLDIEKKAPGPQTGEIMMKLAELFMEEQPDLVITPGDVNSTLACSLAANKVGIPIAHLESGLRSFDRTMPEEVNRLVTDAIADFLFTPSADGDTNLLKEGIPEERIFQVGNVMIDSLIQMYEKRKMPDLSLEPRQYIAVTLHRPFNVDDPEKLKSLLAAFNQLAEDTPVVFPAHPRTRKVISGMDPHDQPRNPNFHLVDPMSYLEFLGLTSNAALVITDSGGIQEETSYLGIPCLTLRPNTERPVTVTHGTNRLVNSDTEDIVALARTALEQQPPSPPKIPLWDGQTSQRILDVLDQVL